MNRWDQNRHVCDVVAINESNPRIDNHLNYNCQKDREGDDLSHVQIEGSCQGCHGGWVWWFGLHLHLCSRFGVLCEWVSADISALLRLLH